MTPEPQLEWDQTNNLYRIKGAKRIHVGFIARRALGDGWVIYLRGTLASVPLAGTYTTLEAAKAKLEAYAETK